MDALEFIDINYVPVMVDSTEGSAGVQGIATLVRDVRNMSKPKVGASNDGAIARDGLEIAGIHAGRVEKLRRRRGSRRTRLGSVRPRSGSRISTACPVP